MWLMHTHFCPHFLILWSPLSECPATAPIVAPTRSPFLPATHAVHTSTPATLVLPMAHAMQCAPEFFAAGPGNVPDEAVNNRLFAPHRRTFLPLL